MILLINIILLLFLAWLAYRNASHPVIKVHVLYALGIKVIAGIVLGLVYFHYYGTGDTLLFSEVASDVVNQYGKSFTGYIGFLYDDPAGIIIESYPILKEPRTTFFIKIVSIFYLLTSSNYWLTSIYFSLISFLGSCLLIKTIIKYLISRKIN